MNLDFASVWETVADLVPENDALICGEDIVSWKDYDLRSSKIATALIKQRFRPKLKSRTVFK
jgi:non-ribosomal peptide synthetase component E (peptide arylation enzyme)